VTPLPQGFTAAAEAFKRLKPAPKAQPQRSERGFTKADRRHDGQRRKNRNNGQQRHPQRGDSHPAHRSEARDRSGESRDEQRNDGPRSSYRPEAYREVRSDVGQPKRNFRGRRGRRGGTRAA
jgi:ATP-dependent RNA helicase RhlE